MCNYVQCVLYAGLFPYEIARSSVVPGRHNIRLLQRSAGEPIPDQILGGAQFQIDRKLEYSRNIELECTNIMRTLVWMDLPII